MLFDNLVQLFISEKGNFLLKIYFSSSSSPLLIRLAVLAASVRSDAIADSSISHSFSFYHHLSPYIAGPAMCAKFFLVAPDQVLIGTSRFWYHPSQGSTSSEMCINSYGRRQRIWTNYKQCFATIFLMQMLSEAKVDAFM